MSATATATYTATAAPAAQPAPVSASSASSFLLGLASGTLGYAKATVKSYKDFAVNTTKGAIHLASDSTFATAHFLLDSYNPTKYNYSITGTLIGGTTASISAAKGVATNVASTSYNTARGAVVSRVNSTTEYVLNHPVVVGTHEIVAANPYGAYALGKAESAIKLAISVKDTTINTVVSVKNTAFSTVAGVKNFAVSTVVSAKNAVVSRVVTVRDASIKRAQDFAFDKAVTGVVLSKKVFFKVSDVVLSTKLGFRAFETSKTIIADPLVTSAINTGLSVSLAVGNYALTFPIVEKAFTLTKNVAVSVINASSAAEAPSSNGHAANGNGHHKAKTH